MAIALSNIELSAKTTMSTDVVGVRASVSEVADELEGMITEQAKRLGLDGTIGKTETARIKEVEGLYVNAVKGLLMESATVDAVKGFIEGFYADTTKGVQAGLWDLKQDKVTGLMGQLSNVWGDFLEADLFGNKFEEAGGRATRQGDLKAILEGFGRWEVKGQLQTPTYNWNEQTSMWDLVGTQKAKSISVGGVVVQYEGDSTDSPLGDANTKTIQEWVYLYKFAEKMQNFIWVLFSEAAGTVGGINYDEIWLFAEIILNILRKEFQKKGGMFSAESQGGWEPVEEGSGKNRHAIRNEQGGLKWRKEYSVKIKTEKFTREDLAKLYYINIDLMKEIKSDDTFRKMFFAKANTGQINLPMWYKK